MDFDAAYLAQQWPALMGGLWVTCQVTLLSIVLSLLIGLFGAAFRLFSVPILSQLTFGYVELVRNTPILVQLFFIFYGLPAIGLGISQFWSGVLCLSLWAGAYQVENIRGGLLTIEKGLKEAAFSLSLSLRQYFRLVALPLAIRTSLPSMLNTSISLLKNSSYLQAIGLAEMTFIAVDRIATDFRAVEMFTAIGALYLALVIVLSLMTSIVEHKLKKPFRV